MEISTRSSIWVSTMEAIFCTQITTLDLRDIYKPYFWLMNRRDLMIGHCGPQSVWSLRIFRKLVNIRLVSPEFPNQGRERLRQEPYLVLVPTTISMNAWIALNFFYEPHIYLGSSWDEYGEEFRLYTAPVMCRPEYGIWTIAYRVISITSSYELYMWKVIFLCDGEMWVAHLPQAVDTSIESYIPFRPSCWQALLAALVQMSRYVMIFSILYSILSFVKVSSSKIQRSWLTTKISSPSALNRFTSALETSENIELCLHTEDKCRIQVCPFYYDGGMRTAVRLYPALCKFTLKSLLFVIKECPLGNIMVVIFPAINAAFATTKCRELVVLQMWLLKTSFYPLSARIPRRCVTSSLSELGQEYFQKYNLLSTRDYVWLFYLLMTSPFEMGNLTVCKSLDECCLKLGYFTAQTVIYLFFYLRYIALDMDDHDDPQSSDDAATAQSQESDDRSNPPDRTTTPALDSSIAGQTLGLMVSLSALDPEVMGRLEPIGRQFVEELVTPVGIHGRVTEDTPRAQSRRYVPDNSDGIDWGTAMDRADAQRLSPELVMTPVGSSGDTSGVRGAHSAINWAVRAQEFEHQQRSGGIRAERLAMGALG